MSAVTSLAPNLSSRFGRLLPYFLLLLVLGGTALTPGPYLLSEWESFTVYGTYGTPWQSLSLRASPLANISFQGYAPLEISRLFLNVSGLPPTLDTLRIPALICGLVSLLLVFLIAKRWFGPWPALSGVVFLAVNPIFSQYQHELLITGPSFAAFCLFFERLQYLTYRLDSIVAWVSLSVSLALVMLFYGPGRIAAAITLVLWGAALLIREKRLRFTARTLTAILLMLCMTLALLAFFDSQNRSLLGRQLLFPPQSESFLTNPYSPIDLATTLLSNGRILLESFLVGGGTYHSDFIEATFAQGRVPMIPLVAVPLIIAGLVVSITQWVKRDHLRMSRWLGIPVLLGVTTLPLLFSSYFLDSAHIGDNDPLLTGSLINYRMVFALLPCALLVGATTWGLLKMKMTIRLLGLAFLVISLFWIYASSQLGRHDFIERVTSTDSSLSGQAATGQWLDGYATTDRNPLSTSHLTQHAQYRTWSRLTAPGLRQASSSCPTIVFAPLSQFTEAPLSPFSLGPFIPGRNYHSVFLSTYLATDTAGLNPGFMFIPREGLPVEPVGDKWAIWSATLKTSSDGGLDYVDEDLSAAQVLTFNSRQPSIVVTTTPKELRAAQQLLPCHKFEGEFRVNGQNVGFGSET